MRTVVDAEDLDDDMIEPDSERWPRIWGREGNTDDNNEGNKDKDHSNDNDEDNNDNNYRRERALADEMRKSKLAEVDDLIRLQVLHHDDNDNDDDDGDDCDGRRQW